MTNCVNCGAPLHGSSCRYCGTEYRNGRVHAEFGSEDYMGTLTVGNKDYRVYIGNIDHAVIYEDAGRDLSGKIYRKDPIVKRKFTLVEL